MNDQRLFNTQRDRNTVDRNLAEAERYRADVAVIVCDWFDALRQCEGVTDADQRKRYEASVADWLKYFKAGSPQGDRRRLFPVSGTRFQPAARFDRPQDVCRLSQASLGA